MTSTTEYVRIDPREATAGDEFLLAGAWHRAKSVTHQAGDRIVVGWHRGGSMAGPTHHLTARRAVRRAVSA